MLRLISTFVFPAFMASDTWQGLAATENVLLGFWTDSQKSWTIDVQTM
jgi:hypothetical protein